MFIIVFIVSLICIPFYKALATNNSDDEILWRRKYLKKRRSCGKKKDEFSFGHVDLEILLEYPIRDEPLAGQMAAQFTLLLKHHPWFFPSLTSTSNSATGPCWFCFQNISVICPLPFSTTTLIQTNSISLCLAFSICKMGIVFTLWDCHEPSIK